jgi:hypothetical protein
MPKAQILQGTRWGRVECIGRTSRKVVWYDSDNMSNESTVPFLILRCDCGKKFEERVDWFKGKRASPDCGCGIALKLEPKINISLQLPVETARWAKLIASHAGVNLSQWIRDLMQARIDEHKAKSGIVGEK